MAAFLKLRRDRWWVTGREIRKVTMSFEAWSVKYRVRVPWNIHQRVASRDPLSTVRSIRAGKLLEFSILRTRGPFLRNPSVKISISTFHSLHSIPCRGGPDPHPLLCLDEVIKDAAAISGASRADEQAENQPTTGLDPGDARGIFFEPLNRSPSPTEKLYIRSMCSSSDFLHQSLRFLEKKRERKKTQSNHSQIHAVSLAGSEYIVRFSYEHSNWRVAIEIYWDALYVSYSSSCQF